MEHKLIMENWNRYLKEQLGSLMSTGDGAGGAEGAEAAPTWWKDYKKKLRTKAFRQPYGNDQADQIEYLEKKCYEAGDERQCQILKREMAKQKMQESQRFAKTKIFETLYTIVEILDPTRITSYPALYKAVQEFKEKQSYTSGIMLTLALLAVLPVVGNIARAGRAGAIITSTLNNSSKFAKHLGKFQKGGASAGKIDTAISAVKKDMKNKNTGNKYDS